MSLQFLDAARQALLIPGLMTFIASGLLFGRGKRKDDAGQLPPPPPPPHVSFERPPLPLGKPPGPRWEFMDSDKLMTMVGPLESLLAGMGASVTDDADKKWFTRAKSEIEAMKRCIDAGDRLTQCLGNGKVFRRTEPLGEIAQR